MWRFEAADGFPGIVNVLSGGSLRLHFDLPPGDHATYVIRVISGPGSAEDEVWLSRPWDAFHLPRSAGLDAWMACARVDHSGAAGFVDWLLENGPDDLREALESALAGVTT